MLQEIFKNGKYCLEYDPNSERPYLITKQMCQKVVMHATNDSKEAVKELIRLSEET